MVMMVLCHWWNCVSRLTCAHHLVDQVFAEYSNIVGQRFYVSLDNGHQQSSILQGATISCKLIQKIMSFLEA